MDLTQPPHNKKPLRDLPCLAIPSHWIGQEVVNRDGGTYHIEMNFQWRQDRPVVSYLGADSLWHGPYDLLVDSANRQVSFNDAGGVEPNTWTLHCGVEGALTGDIRVRAGEALAVPTAKVTLYEAKID
jgi:hypothetical protein